MKIKIITQDNVHTEIDPKHIQIGDRTLERILQDYKGVKEELISFKQEILKREKELLKVWQRLH